MTYLQYHLVFILPVLLALGVVTWRETRGGKSLAGAFREHKWAWRTFALFPFIPLLYTTPWDNYLVFKGVWFYPPERVLGRLGYVPYEEYAFFILQTLITSLWLFFWLRRSGQTQAEAACVSPRPRLTRWGQAVFWLGLAFVGALLLRSASTFYLGLILAWACPVLSGLSAFGGDLIFGRPKVYWLAALPPTLYLWATDLYAIHNGIWGISPRSTLGWNLFGILPVEEMVFFLITNLLVVTGVLAFLHPVALTRVNRLADLLKTGTVRPWMVLTALYALSKIPVPLWPAGFPLLGTLGTGLLFLAALSFAWERVGARAILLAAVAFLGGLGVELLGSRTGFPFGLYSYAGAPGPLLLGVPLLVPLGWFAMTFSASLLARGRPWLTGLLLVAWDVGLEPLMTKQGFWSWQDPAGIWAGAPFQNFLAWFVVGVILNFVFREIAPELFTTEVHRPVTTFAVAYLLETAFMPGGLLLLGVGWGAALFTFVCMGGLALIALLPGTRRREWPSSRRA
ncbi:carotenoid biosynthesis protein [Deinococcus radiomollis]|uniref:carotenoid biosynthesis protein n=1 Tax=Deinococcus radiomollis TaxID=468916 RepID=UPI003891BB15